MGRPVAYMTIDLEDYRRQELRDHWHPAEPAHPREVERQLDLTLELLDDVDAGATFFAVGRLVAELSRAAWRGIAGPHRLGCHGDEHLRVHRLGGRGFARDLARSRGRLEEVADRPVVSFRAPYFAADGCDPWFGEVLAREGFRVDSSRRVAEMPTGREGTYPLQGGDGRVLEVPLRSLGVGSKRIAVIGGTYFRLLPTSWIVSLLEGARARGFLPVVYLHPYDLDPAAAPLAYPRLSHWRPKLGDRIRRLGRDSAADKVRALASLYDFRPVEALLERAAEPRPLVAAEHSLDHVVAAGVVLDAVATP
jgi:peptidoglycan/xylan/chitin deacetylase (PgdA/CDA1 family)